MVGRITRIGFIALAAWLASVSVASASLCEVTIGFADPGQAPVSGVLADVDYHLAPAQPMVELDQVVCVSLIADAIAEFVDEPASGLLKAGVVRLAAFSGNALFRCTFQGDVLTASQISVEAYDVAGPDFEPVLPIPALAVTSVTCDNLCSGSNAPDCDDGNPCTTDTCDSARGCVHTNNTAACDDGNACTTGDVCSAGVCKGGAAPSCNDANGCTTDTCDPARGCVHTNNTAACDDGNACTTGDVCSAGVCAGEPVSGCGVEPVCGNGLVEQNEQCDDGNRDDTDACLHTCRNATCGDGIVRGGFEECDAGSANSDRNPDACRSDCTLPVCGDGVADSGEECDDGNTRNDDACVAGCLQARCGDGYVQSGIEDCDDGDAANGTATDSCTSDCRFADLCGDADGNGIVTPTDAKVILYDAVGLVDSCPISRCDVDASGTLTVTDARLTLNHAVGRPVELRCAVPVAVRIEDAAAVRELQFVLDYAGTDSTPVGDESGVYCTALDSDAVIASYDHDVEDRRLYVNLTSAREFEPGELVVVCGFGTVDRLGADDVTINVIQALGPDLQPLDPPGLSLRF